MNETTYSYPIALFKNWSLNIPQRPINYETLEAQAIDE